LLEVNTLRALVGNLRIFVRIRIRILPVVQSADPHVRRSAFYHKPHDEVLYKSTFTFTLPPSDKICLNCPETSAPATHLLYTNQSINLYRTIVQRCVLQCIYAESKRNVLRRILNVLTDGEVQQFSGRERPKRVPKSRSSNRETMSSSVQVVRRN